MQNYCVGDGTPVFMDWLNDCRQNNIGVWRRRSFLGKILYKFVTVIRDLRRDARKNRQKPMEVWQKARESSA